MALKKWNSNFCLEHCDQENRTTCSDVLLLLEISTETTQKVLFHLHVLSNWIFWNFFVNGKQPLSKGY